MKNKEIQAQLMKKIDNLNKQMAALKRNFDLLMNEKERYRLKVQDYRDERKDYQNTIF